MITLDELKALDNHMFDREIALLLGWTVDTEEKMYEDDFPIFDYVITDQYGRIKTYWLYGAPNTTQNKAWECCSLPRFSTDLNAVWWNLCEGAVNFTVGSITTRAGLPLARADVRSKGVPISITPVYREFHVHPARALATAWATWKLA